MQQPPDMVRMALEYEHPIWKAAVGTAVGYLLILGLLTILLFGVPWLVFGLL